MFLSDLYSFGSGSGRVGVLINYGPALARLTLESAGRHTHILASHHGRNGGKHKETQAQTTQRQVKHMTCECVAMVCDRFGVVSGRFLLRSVAASKSAFNSHPPTARRQGGFIPNNDRRDTHRHHGRVARCVANMLVPVSFVSSCSFDVFVCLAFVGGVQPPSSSLPTNGDETTTQPQPTQPP